MNSTESEKQARVNHANANANAQILITLKDLEARAPLGHKMDFPMMPAALWTSGIYLFPWILSVRFSGSDSCI